MRYKQVLEYYMIKINNDHRKLLQFYNLNLKVDCKRITIFN